MLYSQQEVQAMVALLNRTPLTAAEQLYAQSFFQRLAAFCMPPPEPEPGKPEPEETTTSDAQTMADAIAIAEVLDALDEEDDNGYTNVADERASL